MAVEMVPIHIRVKCEAVGGKKKMVYPDFNRLPHGVRANLDWSIFFDVHGIGLHYDKADNIGKGSNVEWCGTIVPAPFAEAAIARFPADVKILTEVEWQTFYDDKHAIEQETEILDVDVLQGIAARVQLEEADIAPAPSAKIQELRQECLDPEKVDRRGIRKNTRKTWALKKAYHHKGLRIRSAEALPEERP